MLRPSYLFLSLLLLRLETFDLNLIRIHGSVQQTFQGLLDFFRFTDEAIDIRIFDPSAPLQ